ncbi:MAG: hypothetical protein R2711_18840 [Acidimicrobiales bacterium]
MLELVEHGGEWTVVAASDSARHAENRPAAGRRSAGTACVDGEEGGIGLDEARRARPGRGRRRGRLADVRAPRRRGRPGGRGAPSSPWREPKW